MKSVISRLAIFFTAFILGIFVGGLSIRQYYRDNSFFEDEIIEACTSSFSDDVCVPLFETLLEIDRH